jgi:hypothetical protein
MDSWPCGRRSQPLKVRCVQNKGQMGELLWMLAADHAMCFVKMLTCNAGMCVWVAVVSMGG